MAAGSSSELGDCDCEGDLSVGVELDPCCQGGIDGGFFESDIVNRGDSDSQVRRIR